MMEMECMEMKGARRWRVICRWNGCMWGGQGVTHTIHTFAALPLTHNHAAGTSLDPLSPSSSHTLHPMTHLTP